MIPPTFRDKENRRLYTQEQIDIIVTAAKEAGVWELNPNKIRLGPRKSYKKFSELCWKRLIPLMQNYQGVQQKNKGE